MHPATDLDALLKSVALCLPGLNGNVAPVRSDQLLCGGQGNQERIAALHDYWQHAHPEAGRHYWSTRCWTLLIWQPIYLSLLAAHLERRVPCLKRMGQSIQQGFVGGFNLPPDCALCTGDRKLVENAAERLMNLLEHQQRLHHLPQAGPPADRRLRPRGTSSAATPPEPGQCTAARAGRTVAASAGTVRQEPADRSQPGRRSPVPGTGAQRLLPTLSSRRWRALCRLSKTETRRAPAAFSRRAGLLMLARCSAHAPLRDNRAPRFG